MLERSSMLARMLRREQANSSIVVTAVPIVGTPCCNERHGNVVHEVWVVLHREGCRRVSPNAHDVSIESGDGKHQHQGLIKETPLVPKATAVIRS
jgi:hypothetical protein